LQGPCAQRGDEAFHQASGFLDVLRFARNDGATRVI
jgi:hypothetical protein